jgi:hypothetical protein
MKLSKALKLKNKKVTDYNNTITKMVSHNSYNVESKKIYDSKSLLGESFTKMEDLIKFKAAIHNTSAPIREKIFKLGELKNFIMNLNRLSTSEGKVRSGYGSDVVSIYACDIDELEKVKLVETTQDQIEQLQDEIDVFNATTKLVGY